MAKIYKTRYFSRWQRKAALDDVDLAEAVAEMERGLIDADLGGGVFKKRIALPGRGKRGSARTLVATNRGGRWFFLYGFEKNERANISDKELEGLKAIASDLLRLSTVELDRLVSESALNEVDDD